MHSAVLPSASLSPRPSLFPRLTSLSLLRHLRVFLADERDNAFKIDRSAKDAVTVVDADFRWESPPPEDLNKPKSKKEQKALAAGKKGEAKKAKKDAKAAKKASAAAAKIELKLDENAPMDPQTAENSGDATGDVSGPSSALEKGATPAETEKELMQLRGINLRIPKGQLCAIVGAVGSGKSSLLQALVGEMKRTKGELSFGGR